MVLPLQLVLFDDSSKGERMETAASKSHVQPQVCSYAISFQLLENKGQNFLLPPVLEKEDTVWPSVVGMSPGEGTGIAEA